jgi:hypothetical protein
MEQSKKKPAKRVPDSELIEKLFPKEIREHVTTITAPIRKKKKLITRPK